MRVIDLFSHWKRIRQDLLQTIDQFQEENLVFVPFEGSWPVGRIMLHIADAEEGWFRHIITREVDAWPSDFTLAYYPTKEQIKQLLAQVHQKTINFLATLSWEDLERPIRMPDGHSVSLGWIIWHVLEHEIHHRGELSFALGILGKEGLDV